MTRKQKKMLFRILLAGGLMLLLSFFSVEGTARFFLYLIPYFVIGWDILWKAILGIWNRQLLDENFLMAIATVGAMVIAVTGSGDYTEAVAVMLFYQVGELFQSYAVGKSRKNIAALMDIRQDYANVETEDGLRQVDPDEVPVGSVIVVQPGEKIPMDGVVVEGTSVLNTSALTGESLPRDCTVGDDVISGSVCMTGVLKIRTTREFGESTASKILDLVENAGSRKSRPEKFISRFARVYTPAVCAGALALAVLPPVIRLLLGSSALWGQWLYRGLTFLVISCPCALVISVPLTFFAGIGGASRSGILVKGANFLEILSQARCVVLDKTGTLTRGNFRVTGIFPREEHFPLLEYAVLAECASSHPIGKSLRTAWGKEPDRTRVSDIREFGGKGVTATVDGRGVVVGNFAFLRDRGLEFSPCRGPGTVVYVAVDGEYRGCLVISDEIKPTAKNAISAIRKAGVAEIVMLTGDGESVGESVARELGITRVYSQLLPADKVEIVEELMAEKKPLVFVGDGINDAPVLSRADAGIAMGALGSDAAIEAADVVLMDDDPGKVAIAMRLARKCMSIVRQNIVFALGVKALCLLLGAFGYAGMWLAIFADVGVMILAVLNAIRAMFPVKM